MNTPEFNIEEWQVTLKADVKSPQLSLNLMVQVFENTDLEELEGDVLVDEYDPFGDVSRKRLKLVILEEDTPRSYHKQPLKKRNKESTESQLQEIDNGNLQQSI